MSTRKIVIESCNTCPFRDHKGAFGKVSYIPCCTKVDGRKVLPYIAEVGTNGKGLYAKASDKIPSWCPLDKD
ncbi:MAG: hypothetical protein DRG78_15350 [Epsilonproteobacteria bacterium]|nr:MAG: hypothetical protein DRG78_15350 [Campylobacterota bacterium]